MSDFKKEDIRDWAVMFANRCRFTSSVYEPHSVEHGFKEGFRVAVEKLKQANDDDTRNESDVCDHNYEHISQGVHRPVYCSNCGEEL